MVQHFGGTVKVNSAKACVVYQADNGRVHHVHHAITLEGGSGAERGRDGKSRAQFGPPARCHRCQPASTPCREGSHRARNRLCRGPDEPLVSGEAKSPKRRARPTSRLSIVSSNRMSTVRGSDGLDNAHDHSRSSEQGSGIHRRRKRVRYVPRTDQHTSSRRHCHSPRYSPRRAKRL
jgi:hypothetical protein